MPTAAASHENAYHFGPMLKLRRMAAGLSQRDLAKKSGFSLSAITKWEQALYSPLWEHAVKLADVLGIKLDDLVCRGSPPDVPNEPPTDADWERLELTGQPKRGRRLTP